MIKITSCKKADKLNKQGQPFYWVGVEGYQSGIYCSKDLSEFVGKEYDAKVKETVSGDKKFYSIELPQEKKGYGAKGGMTNKQIALLSASLSSKSEDPAKIIAVAKELEKYLE